MSTFLITGANRGLGLEFVTQLAGNKANTIICSTRSLTSDLSALKSLQTGSSKIHILQCDTSNEDSIKSFAKRVITTLGPSSKVDFLINNAGINSAPAQTSLTLTADVFDSQMRTNVFGPAKLVEELQQLLKNGSVVMNMSSSLGSIAYAAAKSRTNTTAYSISKAALNMLTVHQAVELKEKGVVVIAMDPGWVKTDMGGDNAPLEKEESISGMLKTLRGLKKSDTGKFKSYGGGEVPW